jgi:hypothetical protein
VSARTYNELFERPYRLRLERESARHWIVVEASRPDAPMIRTEDRGCAVRFIEAFCARTPGAEVEALHSWRVAQRALSERKRGSGGSSESSNDPVSPRGDPGSERAAVTTGGSRFGNPASASSSRSESVPSNVYPLARFHEQIDEAS